MFYVSGRGWTAAGDLAEGDEVYLIDGSTAFVTGAEIEKLDESITVYNLEVADFNTYFVGEEAVLVHNYIAESGNVYPENQDYNYRDPNSGDYLHIHNTHSHGGVYNLIHSILTQIDCQME